MRIRDFGSDEWTQWITTWVAVATALFTVISFAYKELIAPNSAPVNIALDMSIDPKAEKPLKVSQKGLDRQPKSGQFAAVYIRVKANNASSKTLQLTKPYWLVFGRHKPPQTVGETSNSFVAPLKLIQQFNKSFGDPFVSDIPRLEVEKNTYDDLVGPSGKGISTNDRNLLKDQTRELIAAGELVAQREMKPGETFETQRVVFVDNESGYDFLETRVYIPSRIDKSSNRSRDFLFYAFLQRMGSAKPWDWRTLKNSPSPRDDALAIVWLVNFWCERPISERLRNSSSFRLLEFIDLFQLNALHRPKLDGKNSSSLFCPSTSDDTRSPLQAEAMLSPIVMREAGVQYFTATSEVLLLK
jgi:hypothetical protein